MPFERIREIDADFVIISSFLRRDEVYKKLIEEGIPQEKMKSVFPLAYKSSHAINEETRGK